jgi:nitrogenase subunit NifH
MVRKHPDSPVAKAYRTLAETVIAESGKPSAAPLPEVQL